LATTWIKSIKATRSKSVSQTLTDSIDYITNPEKTRNGELVVGYECDPRTAVTEFLLSRQEYAAATGRGQRKKDVLMYHLRQSFKPGEITPEEATRIGYELAMRFTKGKHAFIVATHIDQKHVHCHIEFNSIALDGSRKFRNPYWSSKIIQRISDHICIENGLSIVENPKPSRGHYGTWLGDKKEPTQREKLELLIDKILAEKPADFEEFIKLLEVRNHEFKRSRRSVRMEGQKGFIRLNSLSPDHTEDAIRERLSGERTVPPREKPSPTRPAKLCLLIDVQNSIKAQNSPGYAQWAKVFSLKQAAKTLLFLQDNGLDDLEKLSAAAQGAKDDYNARQTRIHAINARLAEINTLQKHIGAYRKTKDIYAQYRKSKFSKKFYNQNEAAIKTCKAAKAYFNEMNLEKLPTIKALQQEYAKLSAEKKTLYSGHGDVRKHMQEVLTAQQNVRMLLNYRDTERGREHGPRSGAAR